MPHAAGVALQSVTFCPHATVLECPKALSKQQSPVTTSQRAPIRASRGAAGVWPPPPERLPVLRGARGTVAARPCRCLAVPGSARKARAGVAMPAQRLHRKPSGVLMSRRGWCIGFSRSPKTPRSGTLSLATGPIPGGMEVAAAPRFVLIA